MAALISETLKLLGFACVGASAQALVAVEVDPGFMSRLFLWLTGPQCRPSATHTILLPAVRTQVTLQFLTGRLAGTLRRCTRNSIDAQGCVWA